MCYTSPYMITVLQYVLSSSAAVVQLGEVEEDLSPTVLTTPMKSAKFLQQNGKSYINSSKSVVRQKNYVPFNCKCHLDCSKTFPNSERLSIFKRYWALDSWNAQTAFLCSSISPVSWVMSTISLVYLRDMGHCSVWLWIKHNWDR